MGVAALPKITEGPPSDPLGRLGERIDQARRERLQPDTTQRSVAPGGGALGAGLRIATELVAALCVGLALGWLFDRIFGTRPWGLIAFFFLGSAAGVLNVFRAAQHIGSGTAPHADGDRNHPGPG
jgi:ATP synthase protein I